MAAQLTRRYNRSPAQLREAVWWACQSRFPGVFFHEPQHGLILLSLGMRWPFTSYGETVKIHLPAPGIVRLESHYKMPTQIFELGDNMANVEQLARGIEERCNAQAPRCPACGLACAPAGRGFCTHCGQALFDAAQEPLPDSARRTRIISWVVMLLIVLLPLLAVLALLPFWLTA